MRIYVNGEAKELPADSSLLELIEQLQLGKNRVAAELNGLVVPRANWQSTRLNAEDRVEIVQFVGGG